MKTLILAGGRGTRLGSLTKATNKHLLPLGKWPVIAHVFASTIGISKHVLVVTNPERISDFAILANEDEPFNQFEICYAAQKKPEGVADAIRYGRTFCGDDSVFVILGDNIFNSKDVRIIQSTCCRVKIGDSKNFGAHIWVKQMANPSAYGVLTVNEDGKPVNVEEKPRHPTSDLAIVGAYLFDSQLWEILPTLEKSERGEYEITGILSAYLSRGQLHYQKLYGEWFDVGGSIEDYWKVASHMRDIKCMSWSQEQGAS